MANMLNKLNIITTAAFPWRTGTAILALYRAYYLSQKGLDVRLYIPWVPPPEQKKLFGKDITFESYKAQEECIRFYLPHSGGSSLQLEFYPGIYIEALGSILPRCALSRRIRQCDWLILEEPEHLNWLHPWNRFRKKATRITGIMLTNYTFYIKEALPYLPMIPNLVNRYNRWLIRRHCDDAILLGNTFPYLTEAQMIHSSGIHPSFFETSSQMPYSKNAYFIGKLIWEKGFRELIDLLSISEIKDLDVFGVGKDQKAINAYAGARGVRLHFKGLSSDPPHDLKNYKIFINTSRSDTICSTTAEALGQGKFVIIPTIPGNDAFYRFKNCLTYSSSQEFLGRLRYAMENQPVNDSQLKSLSWEAAVDRLLQYYENTKNQLM